MMTDRLARQIEFIVDIDRLKGIVRQSYLMDGSRQENSAEHSWHVAMLALVLAEHANQPVDTARVVKMLLVHDLVEIDAGDTFAYDEEAALSKAAREEAAAQRIFGLLPADQAAELRRLWDEFEAGESPEARFAAALDRFIPLLHNYRTAGRAWRANGVTEDKVLKRNAAIADGARALWDYAKGLIGDAVERGYLPVRDPGRD